MNPTTPTDPIVAPTNPCTMSAGMAKLFRKFNLAATAEGGAAGDGNGEAINPSLCEADDPDLPDDYESPHPHLMAIYNYSSVLAYEFRHDSAKEIVVSPI